MARKQEQKQEEISGFFLGGLVPLDQVGHVMAALYKGGAGDLQVAPKWEEPQRPRAITNGHSKIAGLLPPPAPGVPPHGRWHDIQVVLANASNPLRRKELAAILVEQFGYNQHVLSNNVLGKMKKEGLVKRLPKGFYTLGHKSQITASVTPAASATPAQEPTGAVPTTGQKKSKTRILLEFLAEKGEAGIHYREIDAVWNANGFSVKYHDRQPMTELVGKKYTKQIDRGRYAITDLGRKALSARM